MPDNIPVTIVAGELAPPACYSTEQERYDAYIAATTAYIAGTNLEWVIQSGTPAAGDQGKAWLRVDINGYPIEALLWVTAAGTWVRWFTVPKYPTSSGGVANALTLTYNPTVLTRAVGDRFWFIAAATSTGATTLAIDSLAAAAITKQGAVALEANDILAGQVVEVVWDGTRYQMLSAVGADPLNIPVSSLSPGTDGQIIRTIGTTAEWSNFVFATTNQTFPTAAGVTTVAHGLSRRPFGIPVWVAVCTVANNNYAVGDEVDLRSFSTIESSNFYPVAFGYAADATNLYLTTTSSFVSNGIYIPDRTTGTFASVTTTDWRVKAYYA